MRGPSVLPQDSYFSYLFFLWLGGKKEENVNEAVLDEITCLLTLMDFAGMVTPR